MQMGWMAPAPIGVVMRHTAVVRNCSAEEPPNASYNNRPMPRHLGSLSLHPASERSTFRPPFTSGYIWLGSFCRIKQRGRFDVVIKPKDVLWVILGFHFAQALHVDAICPRDTFNFIVRHEVHINAARLLKQMSQQCALTETPMSVL